jgi:hypothetical protein
MRTLTIEDPDSGAKIEVTVKTLVDHPLDPNGGWAASTLEETVIYDLSQLQDIGLEVEEIN